MNLKFGKIINYNEKGFGFIKELSFSNEGEKSEDIFFHISKVKKSNIEGELIKLSKSENNSNTAIHIWFESEKTKKGIAVKNCWSDAKDVPKELLVSIADKIADQLKHSNNRLESPNKNVKTSFSESFDISISEIERKNEYETLKELCEKYKKDPTNIRNDERMRHVCLNCYSESSEYKRVLKDPYKPVSDFVPQGYMKSPEGYHRCSNCNNNWYINYCWSCHSGRVDDRDPATPHCNACRWCKCSKCSSCSYYGCETTPYSHEYKYVDRVPEELLQNIDRI